MFTALYYYSVELTLYYNVFVYFMQNIAINDIKEGIYFDALLINLNTDCATIIVTKVFKEMMSTIKRVIRGDEVTVPEKTGLMITGPKGTGKSTSFLYLHEKLKDQDIPLLVIWPSFDSTYFLQYLNWFFEGNFVLLGLSITPCQ